jgi:hypothetical protein
MGEAKRRPPDTTAGEWKNTFRVGIYTCEMTYRPGSGLKAEWQPDMPRHLSPQDWDEYRRGRNDLMQEYSRVGGNVLMIEPDADGACLDAITPRRIDTTRLDVS